MYGIKPKDHSPWTMTWRIKSQVYCPGCAECLQGVVVEFRNGWAWCPVCVQMNLHTEPWIDAVLEADSIRECTITMHGLKFYVPGESGRTLQTAYERLEKSGNAACVSIVDAEPDGVYLLTRSGEHPMSEILAAQNPALLRDSPDAPRYNR